MKNFEEFRNAVFDKAAAYERQRQLKRQKALRVALSVCTCLAVFIAVAAVPFGMIVGNMDEAAETHSTSPDNGAALSPEATEKTTACTTTATTAATTAATTCTTIEYTYVTTLQTTMPLPATIATSATTTTAHATTTTAATSTAAYATTTTLATTGPIFPEQLLEDYYRNGVMTLHVATGYGYSDDCRIVNADTAFAYSDLSEEEAKYFDAGFFEQNALVRIRYTLGDIASRLNYAGMQAEDGKITVFLDLDKAKSDGNEKYITWETLIPIPADVAKDAVIVANVEEK